MRKRRWIAAIAAAWRCWPRRARDVPTSRRRRDRATTAADDEARRPRSGGGTESEFFDQAEYGRAARLRDASPRARPTSRGSRHRARDGRHRRVRQPGGGWKSASPTPSVDNPWRQVGWKTMQAEVELHPEIADFTVLDAEAEDDKQISDIQSLTGADCDALIVSPNTTATLTPGGRGGVRDRLPVIVFDRGVNTDCPVTFIHPDRRLRVRRRRRGVPRRRGRAGRQGPRAAHPARRRRAGDTAGPRPARSSTTAS